MHTQRVGVEDERIDTHVSALLKDTPTDNTITGKDGPSRITWAEVVKGNGTEN